MELNRYSRNAIIQGYYGFNKIIRDGHTNTGICILKPLVDITWSDFLTCYQINNNGPLYFVDKIIQYDGKEILFRYRDDILNYKYKKSSGIFSQTLTHRIKLPFDVYPVKPIIIFRLISLGYDVFNLLPEYGDETDPKTDNHKYIVVYNENRLLSGLWDIEKPSKP